jgi:hypothetical protein
LHSLLTNSGFADTLVPVLPSLTMAQNFHLDLNSYCVIAKPTTFKNPQANAFVERIHQVMSDSIRTMELNKRHFDDTTINAVFQSVVYGLRSTYHTSLAASPGQLVFGRDMIINAVYLANWKDLHTQCDIQIRHNNSRENK